MLKAYLSTQPSSLSAFMISKTHITAQKPRGRQLNAKVCCSESAIFLILLSLVKSKFYLFDPGSGNGYEYIYTGGDLVTEIWG